MSNFQLAALGWLPESPFAVAEAVAGHLANGGFSGRWRGGRFFECQGATPDDIGEALAACSQYPDHYRISREPPLFRPDFAVTLRSTSGYGVPTERLRQLAKRMAGILGGTARNVQLVLPGCVFEDDLWTALYLADPELRSAVRFD